MPPSMYKSPKSVFQQKVQETIKTDQSKKIIEDIIRLHLFKNAEKNETLLSLVEVYDLLGLDKFTDLLQLLDGKTLAFPKKEDFKDTLQLAICYYYKNIEGKEWSEIKELIGDSELPTIKYGIRMQQYQSFLRYIAERMKMRNGANYE
jgi:hypothetical protein